MKNSILQWNCRGLKANYDEILLLLNSNDPSVICLQETFLKDSDNISFKNYSMYNYISDTGDRASGGSSVIVNNRAIHSQVPLVTNLQAVAVSVTLHRVITICSLYLPPSVNVCPNDLDDLIEQLPTPFLLLGDFNGHNIMWGSSDTNSRGKVVEDFIGRHDLCLFNNKEPTYLHPATGSFTCIDLSICHPTLYLDYDWKVGDDLCGSDHFPIFLQNIGSSVDQHVPRWKFKKANWEMFNFQCNARITSDKFENIEDPIEQFSKILYEIAEECIPKSSSNPKRPPKPWFDDDCKEGIKNRKTALRQFTSRPTQDKLDNFRVLRAKARRTIKLSKRKSWREYVSKLNTRTSVKKVWNMVRKISGKGKSSFGHLDVNDTKITSAKDISNTLADTFSKTSSSSNYNSKFKNIKQQKEKKKLNFQSNNLESYNIPFSILELKESLSKAHDTSAGPDEIHYQLLKHLPSTALTVLLELYNNIWNTGNVPKSWKEATVIPVPKPGKDNTDPNNYRPIALTSCVCKTLERMINRRLVWYLESNNIISEFQSGFRNHRSTNDHLVRLESFIREAFIKKEHLVAVFFDLEKAYDTTWKYGIMNDLQEIGLKGRLPLFISNFLNDRQFKVRVGATLSDMRDQEMGVPQGSILSVTLFNVKINNIVKSISPGTDCSLYVDDFLICYRGKNMNTVERQLQLTINKAHKWATENGFKFFKSKSKCVHFCQMRKHHDDPQLLLDGTPIPVVDEVKFLGVIFDKKLNFISHIKQLKAKCQKALNLMRVVAHTDWGADRKILLRLYRSLIRSKLDYGSIVYGSARKSYLQMLDPIHHQGLRLALGAFKTSPAKSLYVEANEPSLYLRREKLSLQYTTKLSSNPLNPTHNTVFRPKFQTQFANKQNIIPSFGIRMKNTFQNSNIPIGKVSQSEVPDVPPWTLQQPKVLFDLHNSKKSTTDPQIFQIGFNEILSKYDSHARIFTDGSKENEKVAAAFVTAGCTSKCRLPDNASIFSAEIKAIDLALDFIDSSSLNKFIIFSDSLSVLQSIHNLKLENSLCQNLIIKLHKLSQFNDILLCWLPSHMGIQGNEKADIAAKAALSLSPSDFKIPYSDLRPLINSFILNKWQESWDNEINNKLHTVKPVIGEWYPAYQPIRKDEVILSRLRIGHARNTHSYLLKRELQPECIPCQEPFTVKHFLLDCIDFQLSRENYF